MINKTTLVKYEADKIIALNAWGNTFTLTLKKSYIWGLIVRYEKVKYTVSFLYSLTNHLNHWDNLILTKQHLR